MRKTRISILIALVIVLGLMPLAIIGNIFAKAPFVILDYEPVDWESGLAGDMAMPDLSSAIMPSYEVINALGPGDEGYVAYDWYVGGYITLRAVSDYCEVWVANDLLYPEGDPRNDDTYNLMITDEMCVYLAEEFDRMYDIEANYFGAPFDRDGTYTIFEQLGWPEWTYDWIETDTPQRVILKVLNIVDDNYYDPTYPSYVAGFYSSTYTWYYYNRNMIHIDAWRWWQRLGPAGYQWFLEAPELEVTRPNLYESTTAHEYQHNIHSDRLSGDDTYMNEACSLFSEPLCGYELDPGQIEWFLATPDNSLTEWGDQGGINILADYGAAFLWALYLTDHYGDTFMGDYVKNNNPGKDGIDALLAPYDVSFNEVFRDWTLANLLNGDGLYGYDSINLGELYPLKVHEIPHKKIPWTTSEMLGFTYTHPTQYAPKGYKLDEFRLGPFGTDYIALTGLEGENWLLFDGHDLTYYDYGWKHIDHVWESGAGDLINILLAGEAYVDPDDPELEITTYWDIEDNLYPNSPGWDFGFVQISTDDGETWTSLDNEWMTDLYDPHCLNKIRDNLPGLTGWTYYWTYDPYITMNFDLTEYAGQNVLVGFRYMTDWGTTYEGWKIYDDVLVSGAPVELENIPYDADFMVTLVMMTGTDFEIFDLSVDELTEFGSSLIDSADFDELILIISPISEYGLTDYDFRTLKLK